MTTIESTANSAATAWPPAGAFLPCRHQRHFLCRLVRADAALSDLPAGLRLLAGADHGDLRRLCLRSPRFPVDLRLDLRSSRTTAGDLCLAPPQYGGDGAVFNGRRSELADCRTHRARLRHGRRGSLDRRRPRRSRSRQGFGRPTASRRWPAWRSARLEPALWCNMRRRRHFSSMPSCSFFSWCRPL